MLERGKTMQLRVPEEKDGLLLSKLLMQVAADVPMWAIREAIKKRDVRVDGARIEGDVRVFAGQEIKVFWPKSVLKAEKKELPAPEIVYEDEQVMLINKPQGIASQNEDDPFAGDSAFTRALADLKARGKKTDHVHLCHRLDVQTGGLLLIAKTDEAYEAAVEAFTERTFKKYYTCLVKGCPARKAETMRAWLRKDAQLSRVAVTDYPARGAQEIVTGYQVMESGEYARLQVELITGRTHQIRAHLAHIGHPILGDDKYGDRMLNRSLGLKKQQLWATCMEFHANGVLSYLNGRTFTVNCPF